MNDTVEKIDTLTTVNGSGVSSPVSPWAALMGSEDGTEPVYEYDAEVDIATFRLKNGATQVVECDDTIPGVIVDLDAQGRTVGIEILDFARIAGSLGFYRITAPNVALHPVHNNG